MPPGGKRLQKGSRPLHSSTQSNNHAQSLDNQTSSRLLNGHTDLPATPKHIPFPNIPQDGILSFEIMMFCYSLVVGGLQFLNLYRTVWWLPHSHTHQTMNFYLVDYYLVSFIIVILGRRLLYLLCHRLLTVACPSNFLPVMSNTLRICILGVIFGALSWFMYIIMQSHPLVNIFYLCYPFLLYLFLFRLHADPFLKLFGITTSHYIGGSPVHSCSSNPSMIRNEVETLKIDFNNRMKQILFSSAINAYYSCFVPVCFAQPYLYYDVYWATEHFAFVWIGCFTMFAIQCFPGKYCDILHRASLHLGHWVRVESRPHLPALQWSGESLWPAGVLVRHYKEIYKAQSPSNAAEPSNSTHSRFYAIFQNPSRLICILLAIQLSLVLLQLGILFNTSQWNQVLSLAMLLLANYYMLFKLSRDYLVSWKVYKAEAMILLKMKVLAST